MKFHTFLLKYGEIGIKGKMWTVKANMIMKIR